MKQQQNLHCFTIGHSIHPLSKFLKLLAQHNIDCLIDIRSNPCLKYAAQFNREYLESELKQKNIRYLFMGDVLGAKYDDANLKFEDGKVDYTKIWEIKEFKGAIEQVICEIKQGRVIVFMCSEKEPFHCHRFASVSHALTMQGITVNHILKDGSLCSNDDLENKLLMQYKPDYLHTSSHHPTKQDVLKQAYQEHSRQITCDSH